MPDITILDSDCDDREGERGKRGPRGHHGHNGHDGHDGSTGPTGPTGATGPTGTDGGVPLIDFLLDCEPVTGNPGPNVTYTPTYVGIQVTREEWTSGPLLIKRIDYTYTGIQVTTEVRKVFDVTGTVVVSQITWTYTYAGIVLISAAMTRDI
jgi:hypothetical protein